MWKKATCVLLFVEIRNVLKRGRTLKVLQGRGRVVGQDSRSGCGGQKTQWLRLPRSHSLSLQARASWCDGSSCWDCLASLDPPTHQCCPDCWESARRKRKKQRSEDAVRWDYNQELLQEREIEVWEYHGENAVSLLYKADQTGVIRSLSNSLDIPFPTVESVGFAHLLNSARSSGPSSLP